MSPCAFCTTSETTIAGIRVVYLENELLKVGILAGKGADIYELVYKPLRTDILLKTGGGLEPFRGRDLSRQRLKMYSELYPGGWQDCLPHRARYGNTVIEQDTGGIAATLPWHCEAVRSPEGEAAVRCSVKLPEVPLAIDKTFSLPGDGTLHVKTRIRNDGELPVFFTWTQHPAFGGSFLDEHAAIELPDCVAFHPRQYHADPVPGPAAYEEPIDRVTLHGGPPRDIRRVPPRRADEQEQLFLALKNVREPWARLVNRRQGLGVRLFWEAGAFPYIRYWCSNGPDLYTVAIEPSNDAFASLEDSLAHGTGRELQPGEAYETTWGCELFGTVTAASGGGEADADGGASEKAKGRDDR